MNSGKGRKLIRIEDKGSEPNYCAWTDESSFTEGRYRSIAMVSHPFLKLETLKNDIYKIIQGEGIKEFRWTKLNNRKKGLLAIKIIDYIIAEVTNNRNQLRVDVLIWDIKDSRHNILERDDIANLQRMYYHLFKNVLLNRWSKGSTWILYPDENSALEWETVKDYLDLAGFTLELSDEKPFRVRLKEEFKIIDICEVNSSNNVLVQVADLFAGLGVYSRKDYEKYQEWLFQEQEQTRLIPVTIELSKSDKERCYVLKYFNDSCKQYRLGVSLKGQRGLKTPNPRNPINFWLYIPQHPEDKAPTRGKDKNT